VTPGAGAGADRARVVVTGLGATTPVGGDVASTWSGLLAGRGGVRLLTQPWAEGLPVRIAAPLAVEPAQVMERVEARRLDRCCQVALIAAREAWADAWRGTAPGLDPERVGVVIGSGMGGITTLLSNYDILQRKGARQVSPTGLPMLIPNGAAAVVGLEIDAKAGVHTPVSACASGAEAIGYGIEMIRSGRADVVLAGGTEAAIHPLTLAGFASMWALSRRNDEPGRASRPCDKGRDGFVLGEGAGVVVLESAGHAARRGARTYCEAAGQGMSADSYHLAKPDPDGLGAARAMRHALADAGVAPGAVAHVNPHATATPQGDIAEARAINAVLGAAAGAVTVSCTKSMTGHLLGAAGAVEAIAAILAVHHRLAPPTINLEDQDDEIQLDIVTGEPRPLPDGDFAALSNSFGFGGHNVCLAFRTAASR
jgi:3-oxoacyl-[acyl-carrier-protein] synthase II